MSTTSAPKAPAAPPRPLPPEEGRRESVFAALRRKWWLALLLCPLGALLGVGLSLVTPTTYTAETRLAIGKGSIGAQAIPGYALAVQQLADSYARWVNNTTTESGAEIISSNIPESGLIRIEARSNNRQEAIDEATRAAEELATEVNTPKEGNNPDEVLAQLTAASARAAALDTRVQVENQNYQELVGGGASQARLTAAAATLNKLKEQQSVARVQVEALSDKYRNIEGNDTGAVDLVVVREAAISKDDTGAKMQRYGLVGFLAGGAAALLLAARKRRRIPAAEGDTNR